MDEIDRAQERELQDTAGALAAHMRRTRREAEPASDACTVCGEMLPAARLAIGACCCVHCQRDHEHRAHAGARRVP